jgi:hypothetical protein
MGKCLEENSLIGFHFTKRFSAKDSKITLLKVLKCLLIMDTIGDLRGVFQTQPSSKDSPKNKTKPC